MKYFLNLVKTNNKNGYNTPQEAIESLEAALKWIYYLQSVQEKVLKG